MENKIYGIKYHLYHNLYKILVFVYEKKICSLLVDKFYKKNNLIILTIFMYKQLIKKKIFGRELK